MVRDGALLSVSTRRQPITRPAVTQVHVPFAGRSDGAEGKAVPNVNEPDWHCIPCDRRPDCNGLRQNMAHGCHGRVPVVAGGSWTLRPLDAAFVLLADGVARDHRLQTARCARESARVCVRVRVWARTRAAFAHARVSVRVRAEGARGE